MKYQRSHAAHASGNLLYNGKRHRNNYLPNLFLAPGEGGSKPAVPYPNPAVQT